MRPNMKCPERATNNEFQHKNESNEMRHMGDVFTWCETALTSMNMLLKTAISRFINKMLAINRYMDIVIGVTQ